MNATIILDYIELKCFNKEGTGWEFPRDAEELKEIIEDIHNLLVKIERKKKMRGNL